MVWMTFDDHHQHHMDEGNDVDDDWCIDDTEKMKMNVVVLHTDHMMMMTRVDTDVVAMRVMAMAMVMMMMIVMDDSVKKDDMDRDDVYSFEEQQLQQLYCNCSDRNDEENE